MGRLHWNASIRTLQAERQRLADARNELSQHLGDPRFAAGVVWKQMAQCDLEQEELEEAVAVLCGAMESAQAKLPFDKPVTQPSLDAGAA